MNHPLRFGLKHSGQRTTIESLRAVWRIADEGGFDHVWDFDHLASIGPGGPDHPIYEGWTLQAAMAEATKRVRIGCMERPTLWTDERTNFDGRYYRLKDAIANPKPIQKPYPPIWIGASGDATLRLVARHADVWNFAGGDLEHVSELVAKLEAACDEVGRERTAIRHSIQFPWDGESETQLLDQSGRLLELGFTEQVLMLNPAKATEIAEKMVEALPQLRRLQRVPS